MAVEPTIIKCVVAEQRSYKARYGKSPTTITLPASLMTELRTELNKMFWREVTLADMQSGDLMMHGMRVVFSSAQKCIAASTGPTSNVK